MDPTPIAPMDIALAEARSAAARGEVPVGAVLLGPDGAILAQAGNEVERRHDAAAHAEMLVLRAQPPACAPLPACRIATWW